MESVAQSMEPKRAGEKTQAFEAANEEIQKDRLSMVVVYDCLLLSSLRESEWKEYMG